MNVDQTTDSRSLSRTYVELFIILQLCHILVLDLLTLYRVMLLNLSRELIHSSSAATDTSSLPTYQPGLDTKMPLTNVGRNGLLIDINSNTGN